MKAGIVNSKQVIQTYFNVILGKNTHVALPDLFMDDASWRVPRSNPMIKPNPKVGKAGVMDVLTNGVSVYQPESFRIEGLKLISEGEDVVALFTLKAKLADGRDYENDYVFYFAVRDGRICEVRENLDTLRQAQFGVFEGFV